MASSVSSSSQEQLPATPWPQLFLTALIATPLIPLGMTIVYRLYFHPLRKVPGPRLAAVSDLYGFYHNFIKEGGYSKRIQVLHKQYGMLALVLRFHRLPCCINDTRKASPIVRIGPNHVHVNSPDFFEEYVGMVVPILCRTQVPS